MLKYIVGAVVLFLGCSAGYWYFQQDDGKKTNIRSDAKEIFSKGVEGSKKLINNDKAKSFIEKAKEKLSN